jgi:hypothetical protein
MGAYCWNWDFWDEWDGGIKLVGICFSNLWDLWDGFFGIYEK